jgi:hypothetical protein
MNMDVLFGEFVVRFLLNAIVLFVLLRFVYFRVSQNRDSLFGFYLFGHGVYLISALMHDVDISMGFAFGLFAVLSMLRYRTESISLRDMTYLFIVIVISLIYAVGPLGLASLIALSIVLCIIVAVCETTAFAPRTVVQKVVYDNIENIRPENAALLTQDLRERLGSNVVDIEVGEVDFLRDAVVLRITTSSTR